MHECLSTTLFRSFHAWNKRDNSPIDPIIHKFSGVENMTRPDVGKLFIFVIGDDMTGKSLRNLQFNLLMERPNNW